MKEGKIQISLPEPCMERWEEMTPDGRGRHCAACSKTVIDFTVMTDSEVAAIFLGAGNNLPCGHFLETQLDRLLAADARQQQGIGGWAKRAAAIVMLIPSMLSGACAQQKKAVHSTVTQQAKPAEVGTSKQRRIKGQVLDNKTSHPVAGMRLAIASLQLDTVTDKKGRFVFVLSESSSLVGLTIASPYNVGDSFVVLETAISDSAITHGHEVVLYRHEVQRLKEHPVITYDRVEVRPYAGVPVIQRMETPKRRGLRGIFRRKHTY
jgi:hypothetical protein